MNDSGKKQGSEHLTSMIARCVLRDEAAFVALYHATSAKLYAVILRIVKQRHWAEEVLQEAYVNVWRHARGYQPGRGAPMTWLINIARNQALDFLRRAEYRSHTREDPMSANDLDAFAIDPHAHTAVSAELARLRRCLDQLKEAQRHCLLLVHHEGFSPVEVAKRQGLPLGTVKTWVRRGLLSLRECLSV